MARKTIFSVNTAVPREDVIEINYDSDRTLLDADIILFTPTMLNSHLAAETTNHWKNEIVAAANAGKLVIVFLGESVEYTRYNTARKGILGTSSNQKVTNGEKVSSYDALPYINSYTRKTGSKIKITKAGEIIASYWNNFPYHTSYYSIIEGEFSDVLLESEQGSRVVGAIVRSQAGGAILFLPPVNFYTAKFLEDYDEEDEDEREYCFGWDEHWTQAGLQAGKRFVAALTSLAEAIFANTAITPPPNWSSANQYCLSSEGHLKSKILQISKKLTCLEETKNMLQQDLESTSWPRQLLYEKGKLLEDAISRSLQLMGFEVDGFDDGESEFDAVFSTPEGRFIGEAEGRDSKAIGIDKFSQLERNLHEDFNREEINEMAQGVLFGNSHRLKAPEERTDFFTQKCLKAAKRIGAALVRTPDMFEPTRYLTENPKDQSYAAACRKTITETAGRIVEFPEPPIVQPVEAEKMSTGSVDDTNV